MSALVVSRPRLLQITSVAVKGHVNVQPFASHPERERTTVLPTDPGVKPFSAIPGPPSLPIIGNIFQYITDTRLAQEEKFNDPNHDCEILVATDAIGMGLNLNIQRTIFYSLKKTMMNEEMEMEVNTISTSQALQIAGRAGHSGKFKEGFVTTLCSEVLSILKNIMSKNVEPLKKAGLYPTAEQVEDFAYRLPKENMSNLIDIFLSLCVMKTYSCFMCDTAGFKFLADKIQHIHLPHQARYVFCCAPVDRRRKTVLSMFEKFAKQYEQNEPLTVEQLCREIKWPFSSPKSIGQLEDLQDVYDVLVLYLWLSYRFPDLFPHVKDIQSIQKELDEIIHQGVLYITNLRVTDGSEDQVKDKGLSKLSK